MSKNSINLDLVSDVKILSQKCSLIRKAEKSIAFVPTMGGLHKGHLSLIEKAQSLGDISVVSIFVNPMQFGPKEDFKIYPRQNKEDISMLDSRDVDILYVPEEDLIYPKNFQTNISVSQLENKLCGKFRPSHFQGVATIVAKLLIQIMPHYVVFGEKDYQQLAIIKQLVMDLNIPTNVIGCPTVREKDGLAMSSRNIFLNSKEREIAPNLFYQLQKVSNAVKNGENINIICEQSIEELQKIGFTSVDYIKVCDQRNLQELKHITSHARVFGAVRLNSTRLIDNLFI